MANTKKKTKVVQLKPEGEDTPTADPEVPVDDSSNPPGTPPTPPKH